MALNTGYESVVKLLIENGADINAISIYNNSALILAIYKGIPQKFKSLCKRNFECLNNWLHRCFQGLTELQSFSFRMVPMLPLWDSWEEQHCTWLPKRVKFVPHIHSRKPPNNNSSTDDAVQAIATAGNLIDFKVILTFFPVPDPPQSRPLPVPTFTSRPFPLTGGPRTYLLLYVLA